MVAEAVPGDITAPGAAIVRPYRPSWLNALFDVMTRLPGPTWLAYVGLAVPYVLVSNAALWLSGLQSWGELDPQQVFWGVAGTAIAAGTHYLRNVAGESFDAFRPALGAGVADPSLERYRLTIMPARAVLAVTVASFAITPLYYAADPIGTQVQGLSPLGLLCRAISESVSTVFVLAIIYQAIRQIRQVSRLHELAVDVDPFRPVPLYAFSRLTAWTAVVLILFNGAGFLAAPEILASEGGAIFGGGWIAFMTIVSAAVFAVPLLGMHGRLAAEKDRLQTAAGERLRVLIGELNAAIDRRASTEIDALDRTISALRHEREVLAALPTWPWSTGTIRAFASALALPIVLFLVQRFLTQFLG
jgi:hypothetical protein